jgi:hypothetical protein
LIIYTDHKNLTYKKHLSYCVMGWRLILDDDDPIFDLLKTNTRTLTILYENLISKSLVTLKQNGIILPKDGRNAIPNQYFDNSSRTNPIAVVLREVQDNKREQYM